MAEAVGLGTVAWSPRGGGVLTGKYRTGETGRQRGMGGRLFHPEDTPQKTAILDTLEEIATETGATPGQLAIAWVAAKGALPIIGPRTRAQLEDNLGALRVQLRDEHLRRLDAVSAVELGFPHDFVGEPGTRQRLTSGTLDRLALPARPVV